MKHYGWVPNPDAVAAFVATLPWESFAGALDGGLYGDDTDALLYRAMSQLTGEQRLKSRNQGNVGSCVGNGTASAGDITTACEIVIKKEPEKWVARQAADAAYGMSRQIVNQLGRWDGSNGSWAAKAIMEWGTLHEVPYSGVDLSSYSAQRCKEWASKGVPAALREEAGKHKMGTAAQVKNAEEAKAALQNGYGLNVCSNQGFSAKRDSDGFMKASGSWAHSMAVIGYRGGNRRGFLIWQSWGDNWGSGPVWPEDMPQASFWAEWDTFDRMCRAGDTFAYSNYSGFPRQSPWDWMIDAGKSTPETWGWMENQS